MDGGWDLSPAVSCLQSSNSWVNLREDTFFTARGQGGQLQGHRQAKAGQTWLEGDPRWCLT